MESKSALPNKKRGLVWGVCFVVTIVVAIFSVFGFPIETKRNSGSQNETFEQAKKTAEEVVNVEIEDTNFVGGGFSVLSNANITATNCTFDDSSIVVEGDLTLEDCVVSGVGINASGRSLSITNTTIEECVDDAIFASGTSLTIE